MKLPAACTLLALFWLGLAVRGDDTQNKRDQQRSTDFVFEARPKDITPGQSAVLRWSIEGGAKVAIEECPDSDIGTRGLRRIGEFAGSSGTLEVKPKENTTYVIVCEGSTTFSCASATIRVRLKMR